MPQEQFTSAGFSVIDPPSDNRLVAFLREHYPQTIRDGEINLGELKTALGLPIDEKTNGYGLNFIGRNVAMAKYAQKTAKELRVNSELSKNFDATQNMLLKGDNLDCLKILKSYYNGKIKCIYIDPPYNTQNEDFIYPDKFDAHEREVLGLANLSENDIARMEFSFGNKRSHNGWLSFMYPRLMLARDLLSNDGVIFISIDDNVQANLKLLCDEVFGEDNFCGQIVWQTATDNNPTQVSTEHEYVLCYARNINLQDYWEILSDKGKLIQAKYEELKAIYQDNVDAIQKELRRWVRQQTNGNDLSGVAHYSYVDGQGVYYPGNSANTRAGGYTYDIIHPVTKKVCAKPTYGYRWPLNTFNEAQKRDDVQWGEDETNIPKIKKRLDTVTQKLKSCYYEDNRGTSADLKMLFDGVRVFDNPKSINFIKHILRFTAAQSDLILDFFAGSGTTAHAVMELNAEDGGNRQFILCQIDEPIDAKKKKEAYDFCVSNKLPTVISSITVERLRRAGKKILANCELQITNKGILDDANIQIPDLGFKVFDVVDAPKMVLAENEQIEMRMNATTPVDRIHNMIFKVGLDNPTVPPKEIVKDCMYALGNNYYITNAAALDNSGNKRHLPDAIKSGGRIFIDGWTASINTTLQQWKAEVKIVF
jgi:DNA modification methylase